jgi:hypothetical protein
VTRCDETFIGGRGETDRLDVHRFCESDDRDVVRDGEDNLGINQPNANAAVKAAIGARLPHRA